MSLVLHTIICSTRPGRVGPTIARWFHETAQAHGGFDAALVDIADFNLPVYDEPKHPMMQSYEHDHTKAWSASVAAADAFVFVTPEYNYGPPPALVNALNYVYREWNYKPASFVSYGGVSGGLRAVQVEKQIMTTLKIMPIPEQVSVHMAGQHIEDGVFKPEAAHTVSAGRALDELHRWAGALKPLRG
ncbi:MAG: NAD(P)H-dependent oxidoreductase [Caulobacter sp.]|nr:NAD(P)H-dependent oxidoreductase [Caulobacter sp.]